MLYHVNPKTGEPGPCSATMARCPYGGADRHYTSEYAARIAYEESMAASAVPAQVKGNAGRSAKAWPDLELYRGDIGPYSEVFVHPQGKIAYTRGKTSGDVYLIVKKNGKKATTSGSLSDLRAGRGAWVLVKDVGDPIPDVDFYAQKFGVVPTSSAQAKASYPKTTPYDVTAAGITEGAVAHPRHYHDTSSILPLGQRGNPHKLKEMAFKDKLRYWNEKDAAGNETCDSVFEVYSDGAGHYKAVITSGDTISGLGSTAYFEHDQTQARMPGTWTLVGAFVPLEGGAIVGEVPDYAMPIYTYK